MVELIVNNELKRCAEMLTEEEQIIQKYIYQNAPNENYTDIIFDDSRFMVKYHLSDYRSSILRWYPFKENATVLEVGAEFGALTGALCDRCSHVTAITDTVFQAKTIVERYVKRNNLTVIAGTIDILKNIEKFDYIILFKQLEYICPETSGLGYDEYLLSLHKLLKEDGVLILEVENKYGIQNICGKKDSHSGVPFDSIANYPNIEMGCGFHKAQLENVIRDAGFKYFKFYYPMPDYIAPWAIYTDQMQPKQNLGERLVTYDVDSSSLIADDRQVYFDVAENGVYPFMTNSFMVEISDCKESITDIDYITLSSYRSRKRSFATMIHHDKTVEKRCLYKEGISYAKTLCEQTRLLNERGINTLTMELEADVLKMPYINSMTVQQYIQKLVKKNEENVKKSIITVFDMLWKNIQKSSDVVKGCAFDTEGLDVGPILKHAYLELITLNSFWLDGRIMYFDQEFVREHYPMKYVMDRNLIHSYGMIPDLEKIISRQELAGRYGITFEMEQLFLKVEANFSHEENPQLHFLSSKRSMEQMKRNREMLRNEGK